MASVLPFLPDVSTPVVVALLVVALAGLFALRVSVEQKSRPTKSKMATDKHPQPDTRRFTLAELAEYNNEDPEKPVYVAIKGVVYDLSANRQMYPYNEGYGVFAGKDASRALALSSVRPEDCVAKYSDLPESKLQTLEQWETFFKKKYPIVGKVVSSN